MHNCHGSVKLTVCVTNSDINGVQKNFTDLWCEIRYEL